MPLFIWVVIGCIIGLVMWMIITSIMNSKERGLDRTDISDDDGVRADVVVDSKSIKTLPRFVERFVIDSDRNAFEYRNDPQTDGSHGYILYNSDKNMNRWGIKTLGYTHVRFRNVPDPNKELRVADDYMVFKLRNPGSSDSYGYFVDKYGQKRFDNIPNNFHRSTISLGNFS